MKASLQWIGGAGFVARSDSGHAVVIDGPPDGGGMNMGVRPMEMVLMGVGGCTAYDVVFILQKARQKVSDCKVELTAERADTVPKVFTKIHINFKVYGEELVEKQVSRAVSLSAEKYCSATLMLKPKVQISYGFEINPPAE